jgi:hypothetical protein
MRRIKAYNGKKRTYRLKVMFGALLSVVILLVALYIFSQFGKTKPADMAWGLTYSHLAAKDLGIDPKQSYSSIINDLKPQRLRLVAYWSEIEPSAGQYNYEYLDYQVALAEQAGIPYVIAVGRKVPRYPECFIPDWAKTLPDSQSQQKLLEHITRTVNRYNQNSHLIMWQLENEPYFEFGVCPKLNNAHLNKEIDVANKITKKPIMMTDSGEGSWWLRASTRADVFGTTMYRSVINDKTGKVFNHFIPPWIYSLRAQTVKLFRPDVKKVVVAELQAEPWGSPLREKPLEFTDRTLSRQQFKDNIKFGKKLD